MKSDIHAVTVYCSSSRSLDARYYADGVALGKAIAHENWTLVYGGNDVGLMSSVARGVRDGHGKVVGITPQIFIDKGYDDKLADELIVATSMRHRKELMEHRGDAYVALPGGLGTFEEVFEIIVGKQLGYHTKPVVLLNTLGYWNPMLAMIDHAIEHKFIKPQSRELYHVSATIEDAINHIKTHEPGSIDYKWQDPALSSAGE